jgi:acetyltransferase-like isoleucine patch superfamily enzyme
MTNLGKQFLSSEEMVQLPFRSLGRDVLIHARANLINIEAISVGDHSRIDADVTIIATGPVKIGRYVHIGAQCYLAGRAGITMDDFSGLSQGVKIYSVSDDYSGAHLTNPTVPAAFLGVDAGPVVLERHVIVGAGSVILPNLIIGEGCAIGSLSLVRRSTDPWGTYTGVPAVRRKNRKRDLLALETLLLAGEQIKDHDLASISGQVLPK